MYKDLMVWVYVKLLNIYPKSHRLQYADSMLQTFTDLVHNSSSSRAQIVQMAAANYMSLIWFGLTERLSDRASMLPTVYILYAFTLSVMLYAKQQILNNRPISHLALNQWENLYALIILTGTIAITATIFRISKKPTLSIGGLIVVAAALSLGSYLSSPVSLYINNHLEFPFGDLYRLTAYVVTLVLPLVISYSVTNSMVNASRRNILAQ